MEYLEKGSKVAVTGRLATSTYENDAGEKRTSFEIVAEAVDFIGRTRKHSEQEADNAQPSDNPPGFVHLDESDMPF